MTVATSNPKKLEPDWLTRIYMLSLHAIALLGLLPSNFSWSAIGIFFVLYCVTAGLGITLGFHRLIAHRSFEVPKFFEYLFAFFGTLACQGGVIKWVGLHRIHHKHSDTAPDPHDSNKGFWWSHLGWMLHRIEADVDVPRYTKDINSDPVYRFMQDFFIPIQVVLGFLLYWWGGWPFVIWGIFVRLVVVFHCTWFVNSATHKFGYRTFDSKDTSRNCWWVALVTFGEGWHNNHHAHQYAARHGIKWWEIDTTWMAIWLLKTLGIARNVKLIPAEVIADRSVKST